MVGRRSKLTGSGGGGRMSGRDDDMFYNPELGDLPEFDLPDDLMLPNIAQDLTYSQVKRRLNAPIPL